MRTTRLVALATVCVLLPSACAGASSTANAVTAGPTVATGKPFPADRCAANKAAGRITYLSGYNFAAAASIIDVLVAKQRGYFAALCLDVTVQPGLATDNYVRVADGSTQFSSGGSFSEFARASAAHDNELVALGVEGQVVNDVLIVKKGAAANLDGLRGSTIGVKNTLPASIRTMLAQAGLVEGVDYTTKALDGFDPVQHLALPGIIGFTGFNSNEPGQLDRAGIAYTVFDPAAFAVPGSFGVLYSSRAFVNEHPTAAVDFMRATMRALAEAVSDPGSASMVAVDFIDNNGNPKGLSSDGEAFRWQTESRLVMASTPKGQPLGLPQPNALQTELDAYARVGFFGGDAPKAAPLIDLNILGSVYAANGEVIWPAK